MTEEIKVENEKKCGCICQNKDFRMFLVIAAGSFAGVFCALSLFSALHKPPMMPPMGMHRMQQPPIVRPCHYGHHHKFERGDRGHRGDFHKKMIKHQMERKAPLQAQKRVEG